MPPALSRCFLSKHGRNGRTHRRFRANSIDNGKAVVRLCYNRAVRDLVITPRGPKAASSAGRLTLFDAGRISASIEMPDYFAELGDCGSDVLAWQAKSVWLVKSSGRVQLVAETDRPIRGVWGHSGGFYVLAGELSSFQVRPRPTL